MGPGHSSCAIRKLPISTDCAKQESADRPVPLRISKAGNIIPEPKRDPSDQTRGPIYITRGPVGPSWAPIGPQEYHTVPKMSIGPVCDIIKQEISSTFRDSESRTTSKFIYILRLGITPLMLKSFISSVRLVNSLY
jgi:hypothetical protein